MIPQSQLDTSTWLTKQEAAQQIGVSTKTIEKWAAQGKLQKDTRRQDNGVAVVVYHPEDVARLVKERKREPEAFMVPESAGNVGTNPQKALVPVARPATEQFFQSLFQNTSQSSQKSVGITQKLFLTLAEAAEYSGLPKAVLLKRINSGLLEGLKTGVGWRIRRKDLEAL